MRVIAIDGPAGAGKSTVARAVAERLGLAYLDTGAMYRSVTWAALRAGIDPADADAVARLVADVELHMGERVLVDGTDVTAEIRGPAVTQAVSVVAANPAVRAELVRRQRAWVEAHGGGVVEGRDIGSVVFPDAELKIYLTAGEDERARRRAAEVGEAGEVVSVDINRRDRVDSSRAASPLQVAEGAIVIDTTSRTVEEVLEEVLSRL